jgi:aconitase B
MSRAILPKPVEAAKQAKAVEASKQPKPAEADPYIKFLNHKIEARLYDGARVIGTLTNASAYALLLETPNGPVIINKAFLVSVSVVNP